MTDSWEARRLSAGNLYWNENRDYHDSDGVDVHKVYSDGADFGFEQGRLAEREARQKAEAELALLRKVPEAEGCLNCAAYLEGSAEWKDEARKARAERDELRVRCDEQTELMRAKAK